MSNIEGQRHPEPGDYRLPLAWTGLLLAIATISFIDMPAEFWAGDPVVWRHEARFMLEGRLWLDPSVIPSNAEPGQVAVRNERNGLLYCKYGILNSLMLLPPTLLDKATGGLVPPYYQSNLFIHNLWNVLLSVALAAAIMGISGLYTQRLFTRLLFVLLCLYSGYLWFYLRAQGSEINQTLFFASLYLFLVQFLRSAALGATRMLYLTWLFVAALVFLRILYLLLIPLVLIFIAIAIFRHPREQRKPILVRLLPHLLTPPLVIMMLLGWINMVKFGSPFLTGYHQWHVDQHLPVGRWSEGLWGFFISRRFSIFLYFPMLALGLIQVIPFVRRYPLEAAVGLGTAGVFTLLIAKIPTWAGEWTYGPRYLLFAMPVVCLPCILLIDRIIENRRNLQNWLIAVVGGVVLLYSSYLQFRVNSVEFHFYYYFVVGLGPRWDAVMKDYFENNNVAIITDSILSHEDDMSSLEWFQHMQQIWGPDTAEGFRQIVKGLIRKGNHYWWKPVYNPGMSLNHVDMQSALRRLADRRIEEAMREGMFDNLPGMGLPMELDPIPASEDARLLWWALRIMKNNNVIPDEVQWRKSIDALKIELRQVSSEPRVRVLVTQINALVHKLNTLGTNAIQVAVSGVELEAELLKLRERCTS